jgi:hypothetical protein
MTKSSKGGLFWAPRIFTILLVLFLSLFALDVFEESKGVLDTLMALTLHLVPTFLILLLLVFAWKRELIGAIAFSVMAIAYVVIMWGRGFPWVTYVVISGAFLLNATLFFFSWRQRLREDKTVT